MSSHRGEVLEMLSSLCTLQLQHFTGRGTSCLSVGLHLSASTYRTVKEAQLFLLKPNFFWPGMSVVVISCVNQVGC